MRKNFLRHVRLGFGLGVGFIAALGLVKLCGALFNLYVAFLAVSF